MLTQQVSENLPAWRRGRVLAATLFAVLTLLAVSWRAPAQAAPSGAELLLAMTRAEQKVSFHGTLLVQRPGAPTIKARIWRRGSRYRLEFLEPQVMRGDLLLDDGTHIWRYHKSENAAVETRSAPSRSLDLGWQQLQSRYEARVTGTATIAGRKCRQVTLTPRGRQTAIRKFWIDQVTHAPLRIEQYTNGQRTVTTALQSVAFGAVPDAKLRWSTPRGAKLTKTGGTMFMRPAPARKVAPWLQWPSKVPSGYAFESAIINNAKREAWLRYTNGLNRFSIFQQRADDHKTSPLRAVNGAWFWQGGGYRFLIVGVSSAQAKQIATAMR